MTDESTILRNPMRLVWALGDQLDLPQRFVYTSPTLS